MNAPLLTTPTLAGVPVLETERLVLRAPQARDCERYVAEHASERGRWIGGHAGPEAGWRAFAILTGHWVLRGYGMWAVTLKGEDRSLGMIGALCQEGWPEPEIGWFVFGEAEGRGIAREAALAARDHAYRVLGWTTAVSYVHPENERSIRLAGRLGAVRDHRARPLKPELGTLVYRHPAPEAA